ncbi:MAG: carboxymuconolactone decarboxylase family protein [Thermodesulfovibrionales bacterium]|nr:carboxymuconolactone decarboxylase family protein [Thermodesulfovibrionales bacterium]
MKKQKALPKQYLKLRKRYPEVMESLDSLAKSIKNAGPVDEKTAHLIQLAAAAAIKSEGAVHSHTRRALEAGAKPEEIRHSLLLLISTIGFPNVSAALSWVDDIL